VTAATALTELAVTWQNSWKGWPRSWRRASPAGRAGSGVSRRRSALDPGFHGVRPGSGHRNRDADDARVSWVRFSRTRRPAAL